MAINLKSTAGMSVNGVKLLVYGQAGIGKTTLISTLPQPIILSAENGLLSLASVNIPYLDVTSIADLNEYYNWLMGSADKIARECQSIAIDSLSEIAEIVLRDEKRKSNDPRKIYPAVQDIMAEWVSKFRNIPGKHVYFTAKLEKSTNELDETFFAPSMPGTRLTQAIPYWLDEILAMRLVPDANGNQARVLQCISDNRWNAKDRSGRLAPYEPPNLLHIINKIINAPATGNA